MKVPFVDLRAQYLKIKDSIDTAIEKVIEDTAFIKGKYVKEFEVKFAKQYGVKHCIGVGNGTDALFIVLKMLGIGKGDEVITTALSWISTSETISLAGASPVFVDIDDYYTIDVNKIEKKITKNTKAIIPVHIYGQPAEMEKIMGIANKYNLLVIEDCAQAHFAEYKGKRVGTFGIAATFSFYPGKNLGAYGDAGAIITNDDDLAEKCRMYSNHGMLVKHNHLMEGINSRLDGIQAAILSAKLPYINNWNKERFKNAMLYNDLLKEISQIKIPKIRKNSTHIFHIYSIRAEKRNELKKYLKKEGIETAIHYPTALPFLPAYNKLGYSKQDLPNSFIITNEILSLPMFPELEETKIKYIVEKIKYFYS